LIAPDILYLIKKAERRISSLYESNKQKILWLVENIFYCKKLHLQVQTQWTKAKYCRI
jgi:hypothetical protein